MERSPTERALWWIERGLVIFGVACLMWVGTISMQAVNYQVRQNALFDRSGPSNPSSVVDRNTDVVEATAPIGRLTIPRIGLSVVVVEGDDDKTLQTAVGHLPDTPLPWQDGNAALAGHRDSFFRPLRHIQMGDDIRLETLHGIFHYRVTRQIVVEPHEVWVLDPSPTAALTLITCYPFDFVGPAPRRFVVHAERISATSDANLPQLSVRKVGP